MTTELYPDFFNDVFGPVMQAGSSSHLGGPSRLGQLTNHLLDEDPVRVEVLMDAEGSFAGTFGAMSEDEGMATGAMGMPLDHPRRHLWKEIAAERGVEVVFTKGVMKESDHINAMKFILTGASGKEVTLVGDSTGGGMCETKVVNGFPFRFKGDHYVLMVVPKDGTEVDASGIEGLLSAVLGTEAVEEPGLGTAYFFKFADAPDMDAIAGLTGGCEISLMRPVLPVATRPEKKPQLFSSMTEWREICERENKTMYEVAIDYEIASSGWTKEQIEQRLHDLAYMMRRQVFSTKEEVVDLSHHPYGWHHHNEKWAAHLASGRSLTKGLMGRALEHFFISATMPIGIPVVPGPHGAGGGVVASSVTAVANEYDVPDEVVIRAIAIAGAVGAIAYTRAEPTGERMGCTGEMGISGCMASALICEMMGGTPEQVEHAASFYLQQAIGWPCDPIINGDGQPCWSRGFNASIMPIVCADMALSGRSAVLPFHEVLDAAWEIAQDLPPELLCTSKGGCAACPTALKLKSPEKIEHLPGHEFHVGAHDDASKGFKRTQCV